MTLIEKSRNYNCEEIVKQETKRLFYDALYETFNKRPYLYDICKDVIDNKSNDDLELDKLNIESITDAQALKTVDLFTAIYKDHILFSYTFTMNTMAYFSYNLCVSVELKFDHGKPIFANLAVNDKDVVNFIVPSDQFTLDYGYSSLTLNNTEETKILGFLYGDDDDIVNEQISPTVVTIRPKLFANYIRKAIIS